MLATISPSLIAGSPPDAAPKKVADAAEQFESLLIAQMLQSARSAAREDFGDGEEETQTSTVLDIAEQQFAQVMAHKGGLGLARLVTQGLARDAANVTATPPSSTVARTPETD